MARDSMTLDEVIRFTKQALEKVDPDVNTEFRFEVWQVKQLLLWLEDYKQLKSDYADLENRLRTANAEIDRLQSVSSWIPCSEKMTKDNTEVIVYDDQFLIATTLNTLPQTTPKKG